MRIQKTVPTTLQTAATKAAAVKPSEETAAFDTDTFVRSGRNSQGDVGGGGGYGTSGSSSGSRSR